MSNIVIKATDISKQYRLGLVGSGTLKDDAARFWAKVRGKEDPTLLIGQTNDRTQKSNSDYVWALKDINFEVKQGEILGIIGKNGAGKSTLLKILSKITAPTTGSIKIKGRIASLLEVGTGFHGELTGRENIYLNGAVLGMSRKEVTSKLDEIVDFAGVEKYMDTPVKRYSSGMKVRLGFAVAAHLDPDILVVDEVLAVGDVEFQKKAIGKMKDVSNQEGRTILFVSHNMNSIQNLCTRAILLKNGNINKISDVEDIINSYLRDNVTESSESSCFISMPLDKQLPIQITSAGLYNQNNQETLEYSTEDSIFLDINYRVNSLIKNTVIGFNLYKESILIYRSFDTDSSDFLLKEGREVGDFNYRISLPMELLKSGFYNISLVCATFNLPPYQHLQDALAFVVKSDEQVELNKSYSTRREGVIKSPSEWTLKTLN